MRVDPGRPTDDLMSRIRGARKQVDERTFDARTEKFQGYDFLKEGRDGSLVTWDPLEKAKETPRPLIVKDRGDGTWGSLTQNPRYRGKTFVLFGGGSSTLDLPLSLLDGEIVYGINWTLKWFWPTFLQVIDKQVAESQIKENPDWPEAERAVQLVTSTRCGMDHLKGYDALRFQVHHASQESKMHEFHFATDPGERITWYANSLGYALNVACWFKPSRIVLLGFDWGGAHIFGDGRTEGASCHYGKSGDFKPHLMDQLKVLRDRIYAAGIPIRQVGPTGLELFPVEDDLETAMYR